MMRRMIAIAPWALLAASCKPWTTRPIVEGARNAERGLDAPAYVASIWDAKVLPYVRAHAVDVGGAMQAAQGPGPTQFLVKGEARVLRVDAGSRSGLLPVDIAPFDGRPDAAIQIGPAIRGTALRDCLPFIEFSQFLNQLEFARVSNELNARALRTASPAALAAGQMVSFTGAMARPTPGELPEIIPIEFTVQRRPD
jgi:predicted lipoprotein